MGADQVPARGRNWLTQLNKWANASKMNATVVRVSNISRVAFPSFCVALVLLFSGCRESRDPKATEKPTGDPYVGEWAGEWYDESKGAATAVIRKDNDRYVAEISDAEGYVITILSGKVEERGLEFLSADDAPDRYLSLWHGLIEAGADEFAATAHPVQDYQGFSMKRKPAE